MKPVAPVTGIFYLEGKTVKVLIIEPLREPYEKEIGGSLSELQEIVGGLIQAI